MAFTSQTRLYGLIFGTGILILSVLAGLFLWSQHFYITALRDVPIQEYVVVDETQYAVSESVVTKNGIEVHGSEAHRARLIAYAKTVAARNPILALPVSDTERLSIAIEELGKTRERLASVQENPADAILIREHLYPTEFLESLVELETSRRTFMHDGRDTSLRAYEETRERALNVYMRDLASSQEAFERAVPENMPSYIAADARVERKDVIRNMRILRAEGRMQKYRAWTERLCTRGIFFACDTSRLALPTPDLSPQPEWSDADLRSALRIRDFLGPIRNRDLSKRPLIALSASRCSENMPGAPLFVTQHDTTEYGSAYTFPLFVGNIRFVDSTERQAVPFYRYFKDKGVHLVPNPAHNYYSCPQMGIDAADVYATERTIDMFGLGTLGSSGTADPVSPADAINVLRERLGDAKNTNATSSTVALSLALRDRSAGLEDMLFWIADLEGQNARLYTEGVPVGLESQYLWYVRNAYLVFFLAHSPLFWPIDREFHERAVIETEDQPFVYYSQLTRSEIESGQLVRGMKYYVQTHTGEISVQPSEPR